MPTQIILNPGLVEITEADLLLSNGAFQCSAGITAGGAATLSALGATPGVMMASSVGAITSSRGSNGQLMIGSTGNQPSWANLTAGNGISITNGAGSITIAASAAPASVAFMAYLGSTVNNVTGSGTAYQLGSGTALTEVFDLGNNFNTNGTFTAPETGIYLLQGNIGVSGITLLMTNASMSIITTQRTYVGPTVNPFVLIDLGGNYNFSSSVLANMTAGDTATFSVSISGNLTNTADIRGATGPVYTWVSGQIVR